MYRLLMVLMSLFLVAGCCSKTTLILLPGDDGATGKVVMQTGMDEVELATPYAFTELAGSAAKPGAPRTMKFGAFQRKYGKLAAIEPGKPQSYILYFLSGSSELTDESIAQLPLVITAMQQDGPVEVSIIGHSDAVGDEEYNFHLSLDRARTVHDLLVAQAPWISRVSVESYGENDPLVPTADNVAEPRNRRVEILIR